jgi:hypothetical protein
MDLFEQRGVWKIYINDKIRNGVAGKPTGNINQALGGKYVITALGENVCKNVTRLFSEIQ